MEHPLQSSRTAHQEGWSCPDWRIRLLAMIMLTLQVVVLFRVLLTASVQRWLTEPQYSHGFVIPVMAAGLAWVRRSRIPGGIAHSSVWGLVLLIAGVICHLTGGYLYVEAIDAAGFLLSLCGVVLLVWGRRLFRGLWPAVMFHAFMLPLPFQMERLLSEPLQLLGAQESAWYIQACGIPAIAQGNTILMGDTRLGVADACSGLRMLMVFMAISVATAVISDRARWEKIVILLSAIPIALICNIVRIVMTAVAHQKLGREAADLVFHDLSGWLMMPLAMILLFAGLKAFDWLFVEVDDRSPGICVTPGVPRVT